MPSGLDLLRGEQSDRSMNEQSGMDLLKQGQEQGQGQVTSGLDLLRQPQLELPTPVPTSKFEASTAPISDLYEDPHMLEQKISATPEPFYEKIGKLAFGAEGGITEPNLFQPPTMTDNDKRGAMEALNQLWGLAKNPYDAVRGTLTFALSLPGFAEGAAFAVENTAKEMGSRILKSEDFTLLDLYEDASRGMEKGAGLWHDSVVAPFDRLLQSPMTFGKYLSKKVVEPKTGIDLIKEGQKPIDYSATMGEIYMAPYTAVSTPIHALAELDTFEYMPNIKGVLHFAADIVGLKVMSKMYVGDFAQDAEPIVKKAEEIVVKQKEIDTIPDEVIKAAQQKVLDVEKAQAELEASKLNENLDTENVVKKDLKEKGKKVKEVKAKVKEPEEKVTTGQDLIKEEVEEFKLTKDEKHELNQAGYPVKEINKMTVKEQREKLNISRGIKPKVEEPITELDTQIGAPKPVELSTEQSPFRDESIEETNAQHKLYIERMKDVDKDPDLFTGKLINDVNRWLNGEEVPIEKVKNHLSELAARADEVRGQFERGEDFNDWKGTVSDAADWARNADRLDVKQTESTPGTKLYDIIGATEEGAKQLIEGAKKGFDYVRKSQGMKAFKPKQAAQMLRENFNRSFIDRSGNIRTSLLNELGDQGYDIVQRMYLSKGAGSQSANMLKQMRKEVYAGLNKDDKIVFDTLVLSVRMLDISKYKLPKEFAYPEGYTPAECAARMKVFKYKKVNGVRNYTDAEAYKLYHLKDDGSVGGKVGAYFDWMKKPLKDMLDAELISEQEYDALISHNYRRIKLVEIYDKQVPKLKKTDRTVYNSGVEALSRGRETDIYESSSDIMALEVFNRAYGRIMNNKANQSLLEVAKADNTNPFVRIKEKKGDRIPSGWHRILVYDKGKRQELYISPEMSKEWITNNPEISYKMGQVLRWASGSPVLRTFATGIEWGFALANIPRDMMHLWYTARAYENGKWKPVYNPTAPIFALQLGRDMANSFTDAALHKGRYNKYMEEGGGMEWLVHQGRLLQRGRHVEGSIDEVNDFLGYFGETSEVMTRLAIRDRVIRRRAKEQGITFEEANKDSKITQEATFVARDYMDFGQGGGIAKAADNAIPYLNASIQGTRGMFRAFKPGNGSALSSTYKLAQFGTIIAGITIASRKFAPETTAALQGNINMQNNVCLPLGDDFGFEDERGQMRYPFFKIPLDPGQRFFKTFFEGCTDKWLGNEIDTNRIVDSLKDISPVSTSALPPTISGTIGYFANKDFWMNEDIWRKTDKPFSWPRSKEEYIPGQTPQAFIDIGKATGLSPERLKYTVEELFTSGSMWGALVGQGYETAFGDLPKNKKEQHLAMALSKFPVIKRFFGVTNPYSQYGQAIDEAKESSDIKRWIQNRGLDMRVEGYLYQDNVSRKEVIDYMREFKDKKVYDRLKDRFTFQEKIKGLPNRTFWLRLKGLTTEARAKVYVDRLNSASDEERKELYGELGTVIKAGGIMSPGFREEVGKLRQGQ